MSNRVDLAKVLIDNLANIEERDNDDQTPLHFAALHRSTNVAKLLLGHGASPDTFSSRATTPLMIVCADSAWETVKLLSQKSSLNMRTDYLERTPLEYMLSFQADVPNCHPNIRIFNLLLDKGADLRQETISGRSAIQHLLSNHSRVHLRSVLSADARLLVTKKIEWSRSHFGGYSQPSNNLISATRNFRLLRPYLSEDELRQISDLARFGKHNLFCAAACLGAVEAIQNFLAIGADVEHQCHEHGTPLMAAASCRKLEAVKWLVRKGAKGNYWGNGHGITVANCGWPIMHWLLVVRHTEQLKLAHNALGELDGKIVNWSGVATVKVPLKWEWRKRRDETMLEYAKRRHAIMLALRGRALFVN